VVQTALDGIRSVDPEATTLDIHENVGGWERLLRLTEKERRHRGGRRHGPIELDLTFLLDLDG